MSEKETLSVTKQEYNALDEIRGLSSDAHSMVMCATPSPSGRWILEGTSDAFNALTRDVAEEIYEQLSPPSRIKHLEKLYRRLSPDGEY